MGAETQEWKRCSSCKSPIGFGSVYYVCSVSTCNRKRGGFVFCSVDCWDEHVPMMRHRDAWAVEETAPSEAQWKAQGAADDAPRTPEAKPGGGAAQSPSSAPVRRRITVGSAPDPAEAAAPREVLVVTSRLKSYVRARFGMNTSDAVLEVLSDELRRLAGRAANNAREDGRKTILERDFDFLRTPR